MKKWKWLAVVCTLCVVCTACGGNKEENEAEEVNTEEASTEEAFVDEKAENVKYTLASETEDVSIEIEIPAIFEQTEYSSESWLALQIPGEDEESSTQLMMYLEADDTIDVSKSMAEEVNYLLSANSDEEIQMIDQIKIQADNYEWNYITYVLEGLEGFKFYSVLENGSTIAGTIENIGNDSESFNIDEFIHQIDKGIAAD